MSISQPTIAPIVSPAPVSPPPKKSFHPILTTFLILFLLAATSVFAYQNMQLQRQIAILQVQPTPTPLPAEASAKEGDPTANWKTYTNDKYGYSFKYPEDIETVVCNPETVFPINIVRKHDPCNSDAGGFAIRIISPDSASKLRGQYSKYYVIKEGSIEIDGLKATKFQLTRNSSEPAPIPDKTSYILLSHAGNWFLMDSVESHDQIISTFKFKDTLPKKTEGAFCGGFAGTPCPNGYTCKLEGNYPDAGGVCIKEF